MLGLYSFVILAATRRNQAIHDLLTKSTVQIRDPRSVAGNMSASAAILRTEPAAGVAARCRDFVYLVLMVVAYDAVLMGLMAAG